MLLKERVEEWWLSSEFTVSKNQFIAVAVLSVIIIGGWITYYLYQPVSKPQIKISKTVVNKSKVLKVFVHVAGAVKEPGVYELNTDSRVIEAVKKAGGFTDGADTDSLNLAAKIQDSQKIMVTDINKAVQSQAIAPDIEQSINLNTATAEQLEELSGVGETIAKRIIEFREEKGSFSSVDELKEVEGIGEKKFAKIKEEASL